MIKFILCEDKSSGLEELNKTVIKTMMNYDIEYTVSKYTQYNENLKEEINNKNEVKIYILDIELPKVSGLEIASEIREDDRDSEIIFVTAHPECKNDIFYSRLQSIDFITKYHNYQERLDETIRYIVDKMYKNKVLSFTNNYVHTKVQYKEINYIEKISSQNKCAIHLTNGETKEICTTITKLIKELGKPFFQSHKSCIINLDNIKEIDYANYTVHFKNGESTDYLTPTSRRELKSYVGEF